jgi:hypothetical protein
MTTRRTARFLRIDDANWTYYPPGTKYRRDLSMNWFLKHTGEIAGSFCGAWLAIFLVIMEHAELSSGELVLSTCLTIGGLLLFSWGMLELHMWWERKKES